MPSARASSQSVSRVRVGLKADTTDQQPTTHQSPRLARPVGRPATPGADADLTVAQFDRTMLFGRAGRDNKVLVTAVTPAGDDESGDCSNQEKGAASRNEEGGGAIDRSPDTATEAAPAVVSSIPTQKVAMPTSTAGGSASAARAAKSPGRCVSPAASARSKIASPTAAPAAVRSTAAASADAAALSDTDVCTPPVRRNGSSPQRMENPRMEIVGLPCVARGADYDAHKSCECRLQVIDSLRPPATLKLPSAAAANANQLRWSMSRPRSPTGLPRDGAAAVASVPQAASPTTAAAAVVKRDRSPWNVKPAVPSATPTRAPKSPKTNYRAAAPMGSPSVSSPLRPATPATPRLARPFDANAVVDSAPGEAGDRFACVRAGDAGIIRSRVSPSRTSVVQMDDDGLGFEPPRLPSGLLSVDAHASRLEKWSKAIESVVAAWRSETTRSIANAVMISRQQVERESAAPRLGPDSEEVQRRVDALEEDVTLLRARLVEQATAFEERVAASSVAHDTATDILEKQKAAAVQESAASRRRVQELELQLQLGALVETRATRAEAALAELRQKREREAAEAEEHRTTMEAEMAALRTDLAVAHAALAASPSSAANDDLCKGDAEGTESRVAAELTKSRLETIKLREALAIATGRVAACEADLAAAKAETAVARRDATDAAQLAAAAEAALINAAASNHPALPAAAVAIVVPKALRSQAVQVALPITVDRTADDQPCGSGDVASSNPGNQNEEAVALLQSQVAALEEALAIVLTDDKALQAARDHAFTPNSPLRVISVTAPAAASGSGPQADHTSAGGGASMHHADYAPTPLTRPNGGDHFHDREACVWCNGALAPPGYFRKSVRAVSVPRARSPARTHSVASSRNVSSHIVVNGSQHQQPHRSPVRTVLISSQVHNSGTIPSYASPRSSAVAAATDQAATAPQQQRVVPSSIHAMLQRARERADPTLSVPCSVSDNVVVGSDMHRHRPIGDDVVSPARSEPSPAAATGPDDRAGVPQPPPDAARTAAMRARLHNLQMARNHSQHAAIRRDLDAEIARLHAMLAS